MLRLRTQSFRRYRIQGRLPGPLAPEFAERLRARRFQPLGPNEERTYGWVAAHNLLVNKFETPDDLMVGEFGCFALRVDRRRVNARLLRAHMDLEIASRRKAVAAGEGNGRALLGREERRALRQSLHEELLRNTPPTIQVYPVLVHPKQHLALVLSLATPAAQLVPLHFQDTFDASLVPLTPWNRGRELLGADAAALEAVRRSDFAPGARTRGDGREPDPTRGGTPVASLAEEAR